MAFEFLGDALGAIFSGGATGLIGSSVTAYAEYHKNKLMYQHEEKKHDHVERLQALTIESDKQKAEYVLKGIQTKSDAEIATEELKVFGNSIDSDKATYSIGMEGFKGVLLGTVDFIRGMIRPALTTWFSYMAYRIYVDISDKLESLDIVNVEQVVALHQQITLMLLYLSTSAVLYWFGTRFKPDYIDKFKINK